MESANDELQPLLRLLAAAAAVITCAFLQRRVLSRSQGNGSHLAPQAEMTELSKSGQSIANGRTWVYLWQQTRSRDREGARDRRS